MNNGVLKKVLFFKSSVSSLLFNRLIKVTDFDKIIQILTKVIFCSLSLRDSIHSFTALLLLQQKTQKVITK